MKVKPLGTQGMQTSQLCLGCMGMNDFYGTRNDEETVKNSFKGHLENVFSCDDKPI